MKKTYSVTLNNNDCIFDEATGFATIEEAVEWSTGRGGKYVAQYSADGETSMGICVPTDSDNGIYYIDNGLELKQYTAAALAEALKQNL